MFIFISIYMICSFLFLLLCQLGSTRWQVLKDMSAVSLICNKGGTVRASAPLASSIENSGSRPSTYDEISVYHVRALKQILFIEISNCMSLVPVASGSQMVTVAYKITVIV